MEDKRIALIDGDEKLERDGSAELAKRWARLTVPKRRAALLELVRLWWGRRFGVENEWQDEWIGPWVRSAGIAAGARRMAEGRLPKKRKGRAFGARAFAIVWEHRSPLAQWWNRHPDPRTGSTIPSVTYLTWASLLAGNWPDVAAATGPMGVLKAERRAIKRVIERYGLRPIVTNEGSQADGWAVRLVSWPVRARGRPKK